MDGRRESALESRSFVVMHRSGLPRPQFQVEIRDTRNHLAGRVDFAWLEALGLVVVRWSSKHLLGNAPVMVERLRAALAAGDGSRFTGRAA